MNKLTGLFLSIFLLYTTLGFSRGIFPDKNILLTATKYTKKSKRLLGWYTGCNFGIYRANNFSAKFYNGSENNSNKLSYVFNNPYWYQEIIQELNEEINRDSFKIVHLPLNMKYDLSILIGFTARYFYKSHWSLNFQFNHTRLYARDIFRMQVFPPFVGEPESFINCGIRGVETRSIIDVGMIYTFSPKKVFSPFVEFGYSLNNTLVKESKIKVYDKEYSLIDVYGQPYVPNAGLIEYEVRQGGIGMGAYLGAGIRHILNKNLAFEISTTLYYKKINLENYNKFTFHSSFLLKALISPFFELKKDREEEKQNAK